MIKVRKIKFAYNLFDSTGIFSWQSFGWLDEALDNWEFARAKF